MHTQVWQPTMALSSYYSRKRRNRLIVLGLLVLSLLTVLLLFALSVMTKETVLPMVQETKATKGRIDPPTFLFVMTGGAGDLALKQPLDIAIHPNGNVYVTSRTSTYGKGRVEVFSADGAYLFSFADIKGGILQSPVGIAINKKGQVFVSDNRHKAVFVFSDKGQFLSKFEPDHNKDFAWNPVGLAFDANDNLYVTDTLADHQVLVFAPDGKLKYKFGGTASADKKGDYPGKFFFPNDVAVDKDGHIFVADSNNRRVQVFSSSGKYLYTVETAGLPRGIYIDKKNRLYVVDALGHDVSIYNKTATNGAALVVFGSQGVDFGQLLYPNGIALSASEGRIYVANRENNRVEVWGWPVAPPATAPVKQALPLIPLVIPPALLIGALFTRRRRFFVDRAFLKNVIQQNHLQELKGKHGKIYVDQDVYDTFKDYREGDIVAGEMLHPIKVDQNLVSGAAKAHSLDAEEATIFAKATQGWVKPRILADSNDAHRVATKLNIESMDHDLFTDFYDISTSAKK